MDDLRSTLHRVADLVADYRENLPNARVTPRDSRDTVRLALDTDLPSGPAPADVVIDELVSRAGPGLTASAGPRYFVLHHEPAAGRD